jgi:hypothetical protein
VSRFWLSGSRLENPVVGVEKGLAYLPHDLAVTLVWTFPRERRLAEFLLRDPKLFASLGFFVSSL